MKNSFPHTSSADAATVSYSWSALVYTASDDDRLTAVVHRIVATVSQSVALHGLQPSCHCSSPVWIRLRSDSSVSGRVSCTDTTGIVQMSVVLRSAWCAS